MNTIYIRSLLGVFLVVGCAVHAHAEQDTDEMPFEITMLPADDDTPIVGIEDLVKSVDAPGGTKPLTLCYLDQWGDWLLTYHDGKTERHGREKYHSRAAIYRQTEAGFRLQAQWFSGDVSHLEKPRFFGTFIDDDYHQLLWIPGRVYGIGSYRQDAAFELPDKGAMKPVVFEPAPIGYLRLHKAGAAEAVVLEGEGVRKGEINMIHKPTPGADDQMSFTFYMWNKGDGNANPTAGRVDGAYKIIKGDEGLKIEIDTIKRVIFDKS